MPFVLTIWLPRWRWRSLRSKALTIDRQNCTNDDLLLRIRGGSDDCDDEGDEIDKSDAIPTTSQRRWAATELDRFDLETSDVDGYERDDGNDADADQGKQASQADDGSTQNLDDWGNSTRECEDWTV